MHDEDLEKQIEFLEAENKRLAAENARLGQITPKYLGNIPYYLSPLSRPFSCSELIKQFESEYWR